MADQKAPKMRRRSKEATKSKFLKLREEKTSMAEIATAMGMTVRYLYSVIIPEICKEKGIPKEQLLFQPHHRPPINKKDEITETSCGEHFQTAGGENPVFRSIVENLSDTRGILAQASSLIEKHNGGK